MKEKKPLFEHQKRCLEIARKNPKWLFACDTGTGKTRLGYEIVKRTLGPGDKVLVLCPMPIIEDAWIKQSKEWCTDRMVVVNGRHRKNKRFPKEWDVMILNYEAIMVMWKKAKRTKQWDEWRNQFDMVILDESVKVKGHTSKIYEAVKSLVENTTYVYLLSGCPAPNTPLEYYTQQKLVENPHFEQWATWRMFRSEFYYQPRQEHAWLWEPLYPDSEERIIAICKDRTTYIKKEDCLDLPPQVYETHTVTMNPKEKKAYDEMKRDFILQLTENPGDSVVAQNVLSQVMKLRQMTAGFVANDLGWHEIGQTKLNALKEILDEIGDKQVLIFGQFRREIERIVDALDGRAAKLYGGMSERDREESVSGFLSGKYQYLVAHPATAKYGFTFTNASYCIWASMSYNYDEWYQGNQRIHRYGQSLSTTHIAILAQSSIDQVIYEAVQGKNDLKERLLEMLK